MPRMREGSRIIPVKPVQRIAWNGLAAISVLLGTATIWLWVRSYGRIDRFDYVSAPALYTVNTACGHFDLELDNNAGYAIPEQGLTWTPWSGPQAARDQRMVMMTIGTHFPRRTQFLGFTWGPPRGSQYVITGPFWSLVLAASLLPGWWLASFGYRRRLIRRRMRNGECVVCGYDLRASAERCPECGAVAANKWQSVTNFQKASRN
jgi:hypothetical protein